MFDNHTYDQLYFAVQDIKQALHCSVDMENFFGIFKYTAQLKLAREALRACEKTQPRSPERTAG